MSDDKTEVIDTNAIYVVTSGEYSDYSIEAVFDAAHKTQADEFCNALGRSATVEVYLLNPSYKVSQMPRWRVNMELHSGKWTAYETSRLVTSTEREEEAGLSTWADCPKGSNIYRGHIQTYDSLRGHCLAKTVEHARRHFDELRRQILAGQLPAGVDNVDSYQRCLRIMAIGDEDSKCQS